MWFYSGPGCMLVASLTMYHTSHATAQQAELLIYTNAGEGGANKGQKSHTNGRSVTLRNWFK